MWAIVALLLILTPIVVIHELGHFIAAKIAGIHVEEFGIGIPPRAVKLFRFKGTLFSLNWIPLGGFVRPAGENDPEVPSGLAGATWQKRLFVLSAGAGANFLAAIVIMWLGFMLGPRATQVTSITPGMPGMEAGLQVGDVLISIDGVKIDSPGLFNRLTHQANGNPVDLLVKRDGTLRTLSLTPKLPAEAVDGAVVGITFDQLSTSPYLRRTSREAAQEATGYVELIVSSTVNAPRQLATGEIEPSEARPMSIVGIGDIAGRATAFSFSTGSLFPILLTAGVISAGLGLTQLLPLPALDGGRILFVLIEAVRGKRMPAKREAQIHAIGMIALLALMVFLIGMDLFMPILG